MGGGRKNLKRAVEQESTTLEEGQSIMQVVSLRGSNIIEVIDAKNEKSLAMFPAKFQKSMWVKRGSFVVVDHSGRKEALESGSKVACIVSQVLFHEQVRQLKKSQKWPQAFNSTSTSLEQPAGNNQEESTTQNVGNNQEESTTQNVGNNQEESTTQNVGNNQEESTTQNVVHEDGSSDDDDDGLPPLEMNTNRTRPFELHSDSDSDSVSDS